MFTEGDRGKVVGLPAGGLTVDSLMGPQEPAWASQGRIPAQAGQTFPLCFLSPSHSGARQSLSAELEDEHLHKLPCLGEESLHFTLKHEDENHSESEPAWNGALQFRASGGSDVLNSFPTAFGHCEAVLTVP